MIVSLRTDSLDAVGFSSTTGIVCSVVGVNDIEEGDADQDSVEESFEEELLLFPAVISLSLYRIADHAL
jgi:hypothetical protein